MTGKTPSCNSYIDLNAHSPKTNVSFSGKSKHIVFLEDATKVKIGVTHKRYNVRGVKTSGAACQSTKDLSVVDVVQEAVECTDSMSAAHLTFNGADVESDEDEMVGKNMFAFRTPKRSKPSAKSTPGTAAIISGDRKSVQKLKAGDGAAEAQDTKDLSGTRPRRARNVKVTASYRLTSRMDIDADSDDSMESEDSTHSCTDSSRVMSVRTGEANLQDVSEKFFNAQSSKPVTSDHTLARLREDGVLDQASLSEILQSRSNNYKRGVRQLYEEHSRMQRSWMLQLCLGFNLLLYGYGSKKRLIEEFRKTFCSQYHCVVVNGFFPSLTLRNILAAIIEDCLQMTCTQITDSAALVTEIHDCLSSKDEALFLFIHNIDGPMLRSPTTQQTLSCLATSQHVHVVASVDHINAPLMWNQNTVTKYRWLWYDATTFDPYIEETSYENSLITQQSSTLALRSMLSVFKSLTPNAKKIFQLMVRHHLDHVSSPAYIGIPFQLLYQKCRESFLVNSDQTLRSQLTEFRDHKLVKSRKGVDGAEHIFLPTDVSTLNDFIEQIENVEA